MLDPSDSLDPPGPRDRPRPAGERASGRRMLAIAFGPPTMAAALAGLPRIGQQADCVELRLDLFEEPFDLRALLEARGELPAVVTLRPPEQGGRSRLDAGQRLKVLVQAARFGAEYVDLEYDAATPSALDALRSAGARVVLSRHDFSGMPDLAEWWRELAALGADVIKVVGMAHDACAVLPVFRALRMAERPTIGIAMGQAGLVARVLALREAQCLLTYAALEDGAGTAPGQLTVADMRQTYRVDRLQPATRAFGLLGPHTEQVRLAEYNAWFAADGVHGVALPFVVEQHAAAVVGAFRELPVSGWHVHGEALQKDVLSALDGLSARASAKGRANALVRQPGGGLRGEWVESPREQYELWLAAS